MASIDRAEQLNAYPLDLITADRAQNGVADPAEPRAALERVVDRFAALKLKPVCALELEFYLVDPTRAGDGAPLPPLDPRSGKREKVASVYGIDDLDRYEVFLSALTTAAIAQNVPVSATSTSPQRRAPSGSTTSAQILKAPAFSPYVHVRGRKSP